MLSGRWLSLACQQVICTPDWISCILSELLPHERCKGRCVAGDHHKGTWKSLVVIRRGWRARMEMEDERTWGQPAWVQVTNHWEDEQHRFGDSNPFCGRREAVFQWRSTIFFVFQIAIFLRGSRCACGGPLWWMVSGANSRIYKILSWWVTQHEAQNCPAHGHLLTLHLRGAGWHGFSSLLWTWS